MFPVHTMRQQKNVFTPHVYTLISTPYNGDPRRETEAHDCYCSRKEQGDQVSQEEDHLLE